MMMAVNKTTRGALISAPIWIGATLLMQHSTFTSWLWEHIAVAAIILGSLVVLAVDFKRYRLPEGVKRHVRREDQVRPRNANLGTGVRVHSHERNPWAA